MLLLVLPTLTRLLWVPPLTRLLDLEWISANSSLLTAFCAEAAVGRATLSKTSGGGGWIVAASALGASTGATFTTAFFTGADFAAVPV